MLTIYHMYIHNHARLVIDIASPTVTLIVIFHIHSSFICILASIHLYAMAYQVLYGHIYIIHHNPF